MQFLDSLLKGVDWFADNTGKVLGWLIVLLIAIIVYDVFARYLFHAPTIWVFDISFMIGTTMFLIGLSYVHVRRGHITVDVFSRLFPQKVQALLNLIFWVIFFLPLMIALSKISFEKILQAVRVNEHYQYGIWHPSLIPFRIIIFFAFALLGVAGISQFIRDLRKMFGRKEP